MFGRAHTSIAKVGDFPLWDALALRVRESRIRLLAAVEETGLRTPQHIQAAKEYREACAAASRPVEQALASFREGDQSSTETLIRFLEADPMFHRSGYLKADVTRALGAFDLEDGQRERLADIILKIAQKPTRREFRHYCRLAVRVTSRAFVEKLNDLQDEPFEPASRQATWLLKYIGEAKPKL